MSLGEQEPDVGPLIDPSRLTPAEREEAGRLESLIGEGGPASLGDDDLALAECLRRKLDGAHDVVCPDGPD